QSTRYAQHDGISANADAAGELLETVGSPDAEARDLLLRAAERFCLSARGYHRVMRVARTIADLEGAAEVRRPHMAEAVSFRLPDPAARR
ncbi:MAG: ATP-binding protein, partial [Sulfitobacter sp.]